MRLHRLNELKFQDVSWSNFFSLSQHLSGPENTACVKGLLNTGTADPVDQFGEHLVGPAPRCLGDFDAAGVAPSFHLDLWNPVQDQSSPSK